ncbi:hypothetical protein ACFX5Q_11515 [Mesorhizobium sp. IMUNJ 23033]|uniref:hypothetical protein n=1 Tax=Mesorhizobium sp. IMUNJ 23033 TaxID=3378039 RepID=UPI00384D87D7
MSDTESNVISFHDRRRHQPDRKQSYEQHIDRTFAALEAETRRRPKMDQSDRPVVAANLHRILERFETESGHKKIDVVQALNLGSDTSSTKVLWNYTISESSDRPDKLISNIRNYKLLAQKAANLATWSEKETIIDLFKGSSYSEFNNNDSDKDFDFSEVAQMLHKMTQWLRRHTEIDDYYRYLASFPLHTDEGDFAVNTVMRYSLPQHIENGMPVWLYFSTAIPSTALYRRSLVRVPVKFISGTHLPIEQRFEDVPPSAVGARTLEFRKYLQVRLGIAPLGKSLDPQPVFDLRTTAELWDAEEFVATIPYGDSVPLVRNWTLVEYRTAPFPEVAAYDDTNDAEKAHSHDGIGWFRVPRGVALSTLTAGAEDWPTFEKRWVQAFDQLVEEVDALSCARHLGRRLDATIESNLYRYPSHPFKSPPNTIASLLESNLYDRDDSPDNGSIDLILKQNIERRFQTMKTAVERRSQRVDSHRKELDDFWDS